MNDSSSEKRSIGYLATVSIGIGGMVGGGIFAVLGLAAEMARVGTPIAFAMAGLIALITSYSYAKLSIRYPSQGGTVEFLNQAFGSGLFTGGLNILLWLSYAVMLSLYSYTFGSYGATFFPNAAQTIWKHILISGIIIVLTGLNILGGKAVGKSEAWIVAFKLSILIVFISVGIWGVKFQTFGLSIFSKPLQLIVGGMVIFLAYEGFELIANTAREVKNPEKTLPQAYYSAVGFVILLYVLISIVAVGNLSIDSIVKAKDYALSMAARPFLGNFGFKLIAVAALLSTASSINATLYGASRVSYIIAKDGELPIVLDKKIWNRPIEGLLITSAFTLLVANLFNLSSISTMGSAGFLIIFAAVNAASFRLHKEAASHKWIPASGFIGCSLALVVLIWHTLKESPKNVLVLVFMVVLAFTVELVYRKLTGRIIQPFHKKLVM